MHKCLDKQVSVTGEAYINDIMVKTKTTNTLIANLTQTFANLRKFYIKLNPNKCIFGIPSEKLLGFIVSQRGIEVNLETIIVLEKLSAPIELIVSWMRRFPEPVYILAQQKGAPHISAPEENEGVQLDR